MISALLKQTTLSEYRYDLPKYYETNET